MRVSTYWKSFHSDAPTQLTTNVQHLTNMPVVSESGLSLWICSCFWSWADLVRTRCWSRDVAQIMLTCDPMSVTPAYSSSVTGHSVLKAVPGTALVIFLGVIPCVTCSQSTFAGASIAQLQDDLSACVTSKHFNKEYKEEWPTCWAKNPADIPCAQGSVLSKELWELRYL